jgi:dipeptidyl aminopeptidase/acylaminoacyl peptidase
MTLKALSETNRWKMAIVVASVGSLFVSPPFRVVAGRRMR